MNQISFNREMAGIVLSDPGSRTPNLDQFVLNKKRMRREWALGKSRVITNLA
jgi:hypothetical protein